MYYPYELLTVTNFRPKFLVKTVYLIFLFRYDCLFLLTSFWTVFISFQKFKVDDVVSCVLFKDSILFSGFN